MNKEVLLQPVVIARDADQQCLIEGSINSVRISIKIKQMDALDTVRALPSLFRWPLCMVRMC